MIAAPGPRPPCTQPTEASLRALFPELVAASAASAASASSRSAWRAARRPGCVLGPGLLRTPPFGRHLPWLSGVVLRGWSASGVAGPGSMEAALLDAANPAVVAETAPLARRVVAEGLAGDVWIAPADPAVLRLGRVLVRVEPGLTGRRALAAALAAHPAESLMLLADHPGDVRARTRAVGCAVIAWPADPWPLLEGAAAVYASGDDNLALLAILEGVPLHCHAPGIAAGWGVSHDAQGIEPRSVRRSAAEIAHAALVSGVRYADPFTAHPINCAAALDIAALWRRTALSNRTIGCATGMAFWKRERMGRFLQSGSRPLPHRSGAAGVIRAASGRDVAAWSSRVPAGLEVHAAKAGVRVVRVEDGFIRGAGLGSDFRPPCSVIADATGIYYDPSRPSDLERLLQETVFSGAVLGRARALVARLLRDGITKYGANVESVHLAAPPGIRTVMVPGQVGDDLSVALGGAGVAGNTDLLARVRAANPRAYVIYKPHPDVDAGHRTGAVPDADALRFADVILRGVPMAALLGAVDEVHTLTSLAGFEALLRGRRVVTYGQPFYAGWGLTDDRAPIPRRTRRLTLDELAAGVLLMYPRYIDPVTGLPCPAEILLDRLAQPDLWRAGPLVRLRQWQGRAFRTR